MTVRSKLGSSSGGVASRIRPLVGVLPYIASILPVGRGAPDAMLADPHCMDMQLRV